MRFRERLASARSGFAAALGVALLPQCACALGSGFARQGEPPAGSTADQAFYSALAPGLAPAIENVWLAIPVWSSPGAEPAYRPMVYADGQTEDPASLQFDTDGYDAMWDDAKFSEMSAYGGLNRDALRVAGMRAMDGSDGASGAMPYGRLMVSRDFRNGQQQLALGAYGMQATVRQTALSGFGDDSYTDVAMDGTWRWTAPPESGVSDTISAHLLVLHEDESLVASHAIFGTRRVDDLTVMRGDASWSWGANLAPDVQYFRVTGSPDPIRLGTLDGSPDSNGFIAGIDYLPSGDARAPANPFELRLSLQFIAYSEFDGSSRDASHNNTLLLHLSAGTD